MASQSQQANARDSQQWSLPPSSLPDSAVTRLDLDLDRMVQCRFRNAAGMSSDLDGCGKWFSAGEMADVSEHGAVCPACWAGPGSDGEGGLKSESGDSILSATTLQMATPGRKNPPSEQPSGSRAKRTIESEERSKESFQAAPRLNPPQGLAAPSSLRCSLPPSTRPHGHQVH